jgi:hypothetical protein
VPHDARYCVKFPNYCDTLGDVINMMLECCNGRYSQSCSGNNDSDFAFIAVSTSINSSSLKVKQSALLVKAPYGNNKNAFPVRLSHACTVAVAHGSDRCLTELRSLR